MADANGQPAHTVMRDLETSAREFDLFEALRCLQCAFPGKPAIGASCRAADDPVRFGQKPSLSFAATAIESFEPGDGQKPPRLYQQCFGLFGPNGPLPLHLTEYARDRLLNHGDRTLSSFLDVFHHRLLSLFFRAWAVHQPTVQYERGAADRFAFYTACLVGLGTDMLRGRDSVPDAAKFHYAGRLVSPARNAEGLREILGDYFATPVRLEQFVGQWLEIPPECRWQLGRSPDTGALGVNTLTGTRVWDCRQKFRLRLGPMSAAQYENLLPGRPGFAQLRDWVRNYAGDALEWEAQLVLRRADVPRICLGRTGRLGWTTWVRSGSEERDRADLVVRPRIGERLTKIGV